MSRQHHVRTYPKVIAIPIVLTQNGPCVLVAEHRESRDLTFFGGGWKQHETLADAIYREAHEEAGIPKLEFNRALVNHRFTTIWFTNTHRPQHAERDRKQNQKVIELYCGCVFVLNSIEELVPKDKEVSRLLLLNAANMQKMKSKFWDVMVRCGVYNYVMKQITEQNITFSANSQMAFGMYPKHIMDLGLPQERVSELQLKSLPQSQKR